MRKLIIVAITILSTVTYGQHSLGINGGISLSQVTDPSGLGHQGLYSGLNYTFQFNNRVLLSSGIEFEEKGDTDAISWVDLNGWGYYAESELKMHYISVPLTVGYSFGRRLHGAVNIGVIGRYLANVQSTTQNFTDNGQSLGGYVDQRTQEFNRFDLGALIQLNGGFAINDHHAISLTTRVSYGITGVLSDLPEGASTKRNRGVVFALGYTYSL